MKHMKNWLGIMMSIMLAASSLQVPVYAANADETVTGTETGSAGAEAADPLADEDIDEENRSDAAGPEETAGTDDSANKDADSEDADSEDADSENSDSENSDSADDGNDQPADSEGTFSDVSEDQDSYEEEASGEYEDANKPAASDDGTSETEKESIPVNELTQEQMDEYQKSLKIWKHENKVFLVCDSGENLQFSRLSYSIYDDRSDDLLFSGNLHRDERSGLYYDAVDFDDFDNDIDISDIPVRVVFEIETAQNEAAGGTGAFRLEEAASNDTGIVSITDVYSETDGQITVKWDRSGNTEVDGYSVIVRGSGEDSRVFVYDTDPRSDREDDDSYSFDLDEDQITIDILTENVRDISVAAYKYDDSTGMKRYGEAGSYDLAASKENADEEQKEEEVEEQPVTEDINETEPGQDRKASSEAASEEVASGKCGKDLTWSLDSEGTLTISGTGSMTEYYEYANANLGYTVCPWRSYEIKKVIVSSGATSISNYAFSNCTTLESVELPNSITRIGKAAFFKCSSLATADIPRSVTYIGESAFNGCSSLTSVMLPEGLSSIQSMTFQGCKKLENVEIPDSVTKIGSFAFSNCTGLTSVKIPDGVSSIENGTFSGCRKLSSVTIPYGVSSIGNSAFSSCLSLSSLRIPSSVKSIGTNAFSSCYDLQYIDIPISVTAIQIGTFSKCTSLESIMIPNSITMIGEQAFEGCTKLANVTIPNSVTRIDSNAFAECENLQNITLPNRLTVLSRYTFRMCSNLKSVTIPKSIRMIDAGAFKECTNLEIIYYNGTMSEWESIDTDETENEPLLNARVILAGDRITLDPAHSCQIGETITVSAAYISAYDTPVTADIQSEAGEALECSEVSVSDPHESDSVFESTISFTVTGKNAGEYKLTLTTSDGLSAETVIKVNPIDISKAGVKLNCPDQFDNGCDCFPYTGKEITPEVLEVKIGSRQLTLNTDYTISYSQNINYGEALVHIKGTGNYSGEKTAKFMIVPAKVKNLRYADTACGYNKNNNVGSKHRCLEMEWDAGNNVSGYWVEYSEDRTFPDSTYQLADVNTNKCSQEGLKRNTKYYVRIKAYIYINKDIYFGEYSDVKEYQACNHLFIEDFWGFGNILRKTPESYFRAFFTPAQAHKFAENLTTNGESGFCFGMSHLAKMILCYGYPEFSDIGVSSLYQINSFDQISFARESIYYVMTMERFKCYGEKNEVTRFYDWVMDYTLGKRNPCAFMVHNDKGGHSLVALDIVEKDKDHVKVLIYDPNYPGEKRYLYLYADNHDGKYTRWSYDSGKTVLGELEGTNGDKTGDYIRICGEENERFMCEALKEYYGDIGPDPLNPGEDPYIDYEQWLMSLDAGNSTVNFMEYVRLFDKYNGNYNEIMIEITDEADSDESGRDTVFFWVPKTSDHTLSLKDVPAGIEIHIAGNMHAVDVTVTEDCDLSICLPETGEGEVQVTSDADAEARAAFYDYDEDGDRTKTTYTEACAAGTPVNIVKHADGEADQPVASGTCGDDLTWTLDDEGVLRISGTGEIRVSEDSDYREYGADIKKVIIKKGVTAIGSDSFKSLTNLSYVSIPEGVTAIRTGAFSGCKSLKNVTLPTSLEVLEYASFGGCTGLTSVTIPKNVNTIVTFSFGNPFSACTSLTSVNVDPENEKFESLDGVLFSKNHFALYCYPGGKKDSHYTVPQGVYEIGGNAFAGCPNLTRVTLPDSLHNIYFGAFAGSHNPSGLTIMIPASVTHIYSKAFYSEKDIHILYAGTKEQWEAVTDTNNNYYNSIVYNYFSVDADFELSETSFKYNGKEIRPDVTVTYGDHELVEGTDYELVYRDNVAPGTGSVDINGIGDYSGTATQTFTIAPGSVSELTISGIVDKTYNRKAQTQAVVIKDGDVTLVNGTDYSVSYKNNTNAGTASVIITGIGNYTGSVTKTFKIKKAVNQITAKHITRNYSTKSQAFAIEVKISNGTPKYASSTKSVTVSKNGTVTVKAGFIGKATITVTAPEYVNFSKTTKKILIVVNPPKTGIASLSSPAAGKMTVKWKKNAIGTGYQIQYSTSNKFTNAKSFTVTKNTIVSKTFTGLAKGKKYYVRMRTYKTIGGVKFYSGWCIVKTVTIRK